MKQIILSVLVLLAVAGCTDRPQKAGRLPEDVLKEARSNLEHYLTKDAMTQSEMNIISSHMFQLANMEKYMIEYRIWNQDNYDKIEKEFQADCEAWEKRIEAEAKKPSQFEGGTLAPLDNSLRMTSFIEERIDELRTRWIKK